MDKETSLFYLVSPKKEQSRPFQQFQGSQSYGLSKFKSKSVYKLNELYTEGNLKSGFKNLKRETFDFKVAFKREANVAKEAVAGAAAKISFKVPESWSHKNLIQKILPADFSPKTISESEDFNDVKEQVYIHVYKLKDSDLGFYHSGIELHGTEFTFCCDRGIVRHKPRKCDWGDFLGSIRLGEVSLGSEQLEELLENMSSSGFASADYDVMEKSCNTFTEAFAGRMGLMENFPSAVHNQTKLGQLLAPVVRALDMAAEKSGPLDPNLLQPASTLDPDSGHASLTPGNSMASSPSFSSFRRRLSISKLGIEKTITESGSRRPSLTPSDIPEIITLSPLSPTIYRSRRRTSLLPELPTSTNTYATNKRSSGSMSSLLSRSASFTPASSRAAIHSNRYKAHN